MSSSSPVNPPASSVPRLFRQFESATRERYAAAAAAPEAALCCPVEYNQEYLKIIPPEVIEKDYGCGDPARHVKPGETVLDLGSGTGKICFIAAQVVGPSGRVIGVDMTDAMLEVARRNAPIVAERLGCANVEFRKGRIQDLGLDLERLEAELQKQPIASAHAFLHAQELADDLRARHPLVATGSIDVVVSNCVLNLVEARDKQAMFREIFRVLRPGGRAVISDIVSDEDIPASMQKDSQLWSGCISGAWREEMFLRAFEDAGFHGVRLLKRDARPWQTVQGIEFRSVTVEAFKGHAGGCCDLGQAVIYRGPFRVVELDGGMTFRRGDRVAVCDRIFELCRQSPYAGTFEFIDPERPAGAPSTELTACNCATQPGRLRHPRETKGLAHPTLTSGARTSTSAQCCEGNAGKCC